MFRRYHGNGGGQLLVCTRLPDLGDQAPDQYCHQLAFGSTLPNNKSPDFQLYEAPRVGLIWLTPLNASHRCVATLYFPQHLLNRWRPIRAGSRGGNLAKEGRTRAWGTAKDVENRLHPVWILGGWTSMIVEIRDRRSGRRKGEKVEL